MPGPVPSDKSIAGAFNPKAFKRVLGMLERTGYVGCLQVTRVDATKYVYFTVGGVRLHVTGSKQKVPIGKLLVRYGKVKPSQLEDAVAIQNRTGRKMGEVLTKFMKVVTPQIMQEMIRIQVENEIFDLLTWEGAAFQFHEKMQENLFEEKLKATTISVNIEELAAKLASRIEKWSEIQEKVPDMRGAYKLTKAGSDELARGGMGGFYSEFVSLLDGRKTLAETGDSGNFGLYETCEIAADLLGREWIVRTGGGGGGEFEEVQDVFQEIAMLEKALEAAPEDELLRFKLAHAYQESRQKEKAAANYSILAEQKFENYRVDEAVELLEKAVLLNPNDFDSQERLFDLYRGHKPEKATAHGIKMAEIYKSNRLPNRTKNILLQTLDIDQKNHRARRLLAEVYTMLEETKPAVAQYEQLAQLLKDEKKDEARLKEIYEKILILDEDHKAAKKELRKLYYKTGQEIGRYARIAVTAAALLAAAASVAYELAGRLEYRAVAAETARLSAEGEHRKARDLAAEFDSKYFLTSASARAKETIRALDSHIRAARNAEVFQGLGAYEGALAAGRVKDLAAAIEEMERILASADISPELRALIQSLEGRIQGFLAEYARAKDVASRVGGEQAYGALRALLKLSSGIVPDEEVQIDFPIRTEPSGADVYVDGARLDRETVRLSLGARSRIRVEHPGYEPLEFETDAASAQWPVKARLSKLLVWKTYAGGPVSIHPASWGGFLIVASDNGRITAIARESGHVRKSLVLEAACGPAAPPLIIGRQAFYPMADGGLALVDVENMVFASRVEAGGPPSSRPFAVSPPGKGVLLLLRNGSIRLLPEGADAFEAIENLGTEMEPGANFSEDVLVACATDGRIAAFDLKLNRVSWTASLSSAVSGPPAVAKGVVYAATKSGDLWALSIVTGKPLQGWPYRSESAFSAGPEVSENCAYVGSPDRHVYCVSLSTGRLEWKVHVESPVTSECTQSGSAVYFGTSDGRLVAVDTVDRRVKWSFATGGPVLAKPLATGDSVVFASTDGHVYSVRE